MTGLLRALALLAASAAVGVARAEAPSIASATPFAVAPGKTTELMLRGGALSGATGVWSSFPAGAALVAGGPANNNAGVFACRLTLPPDAPLGVGAIRVATRGGVSGVYLVMVDDLPSAAESGGNRSAARAQSIAAPVAVDGNCDAGASDYFRFAGRKGQRVSVEVVAARLGSQLDPVLRLLDPGGRELAWCDDAPGVAPDCRIAHTIPADGEYVIELRDAGYEGGPAHRYRLRVGDFPLANVPCPLGGKRGTRAKFSFAGPDCAGTSPATLNLPAEGTRQPLTVAWADAVRRPGGSGFVAAVVGDRDEASEVEPNDETETGSVLPAAPVTVNGRFEKQGDRDHFRLPGKKGQRLALRARTRSLGSPCDARLRLLKPDGSKLAESKVEGPGEGALDATLPEDGAYGLAVEDINRAGGPGLAYRVEIEPYRAGFTLTVEADKFDARPGDFFEVKVTCARRDYGGAVTLAVEGIGGSPTLEGATIPAGKNETTLRVKVPGEAAAGPGGPVLFRIVGSAEIGGEHFSSTASTMAALRRLFPRMLYPPEGLDGVMALGVRAAGE